MSIPDDIVLLIENLGRILHTQGYEPVDTSKLPEEIGWNPDRIFQNSSEQQIALEIEEEVNIPTFLIRIIEKYENLLKNTKIVVAAIRNKPLKISTVRLGLKYNISIYAGVSNPSLILDSSLPDRMTQVSADSIKVAWERFKANKRIPLELTNELRNLSHIIYASDLRQFAHDYENLKFNNWEAEHQFVHDFLTNRFGHLFAENMLLEGLNAVSLLEEISEVQLGKRPYFLHTFQTFLLGAIIIDRNYQLFQDMYTSKFEGDTGVSFDIPWFFTALFHDVAAPIERIDQVSPVGGLREPQPRGISSLYAPHLLSCLFDFVRKNEIEPEWQPQPGSSPGSLYPLLARNRVNEHGVMGALFLINSSQYMNNRTATTIMYPAALAISIHNSTLWPALVDTGCFPVSIRKFPLVFLLLLCDSVEEWGRESQYSEVNDLKPKALVTDIGFSGKLVDIQLWVDDASRAGVIQNRFDWVTKRICNLDDMQIGCTFSRSQAEV